jgi:transaldolase
LPEYKHLVDDAVAFADAAEDSSVSRLDLCMDKLAVNFGCEILKHITGQVSTEVDARLSFDAEANIDRARRIIGMYEDAGIGKDRVLIKLASTWEGLQAARVLEAEGIRCNMTLLFDFCQAAVAAEVGATLISPFVGRIRDYYVKSGEYKDSDPAECDPGVTSVRSIWAYYKKCGFATIVMGASFRNVDEIKALAGCDRLTIGPSLLEQLGKESGVSLTRHLEPSNAAMIDEWTPSPTAVNLDEKSFRWALNENPMATEKLAEGIRKFTADLVKLEAFVSTMLRAD